MEMEMCSRTTTQTAARARRRGLDLLDFVASAVRISSKNTFPYPCQPTPSRALGCVLMYYNTLWGLRRVLSTDRCCALFVIDFWWPHPGRGFLAVRNTQARTTVVNQPTGASNTMYLLLINTITVIAVPSNQNPRTRPPKTP